MSKKGSLVIISGFSGAGKGTVVKELMKNYECYALSISATTRNPRPGEENGREYFFKTKEEFEELIRQDALYDYAQYVDNYYGTPKAYVEEQLAAGKDVILDKNGFILVQNAESRTFDSSKDYLFPLPLREVSLNPNLKQNPNW